MTSYIYVRSVLAYLSQYDIATRQEAIFLKLPMPYSIFWKG